MRRTDYLRVPDPSPAVGNCLRAAMTLVLIGLFSPTLPAFNVWVGNGSNNNWTTGANWSPFFGPPPNDGTDVIVMQGTTRLTPVVNTPQSIQSLTFNNTAGAFVILGAQELTIGAGGITNNDADIQSIIGPVELSVGQIWNAAAGRLQMDAVNLNGFTLALVGAHPIDLLSAITGTGRLEMRDTYSSTVTMAGGNNNTYTGETVVAGGTLRLQKTSGAIAVAGNLGVNSGGSVILGGNEQISHAPGTEVTVGHPFTTGSLNLNGFNETIHRLDVQGGSVTTGAGTLSIGQSLSVRTADASITGNLELGDVSANIFADGQVATARAITIGEAGTGFLGINSGGDVTNGQASIGNQAGSTGYVNVSNGSTWTTNGQLYVGNGGGGILNIEFGGEVSNGGSFIGNQSGATGAVTVSGAGSTWTNNGALYVGVAGTGTLNVTAGGTVNSNFGNIVDGQVTVDGSGSAWTIAASLALFGGALDITGGGRVTVGTTTSVLSEVNVSGGTLDAAGELTLHGSMTADAAAVVEFNSGVLKNGSSLSVRNQSEYSVANILLMESGTTSRVSSGAKYNSGATNVGTTPGPAAQLIIDGAGTLVTAPECCIDVGYGGTGIMTVTGGARVETGTGAVGSFQFGTAPSIGTLTLDGTDASGNPSTWLAQFGPNIALSAASQGTISIINGAHLRTINSLSLGEMGSGDVLVSGTDETGNPSLMDVGRLVIASTASGTGELTATEGGRIEVGDLWLARNGGAATVTITDPGSNLAQSDALTMIIGHATDGTATLNIRNNARLTSGTGPIDVHATGAINLETGAIFDAHGPINLNGGQFNFLGGTLHVDDFNGNLLNQGGTLAPGHSIGATDVSNNYTQLDAATLEIEIGGILPGEWDTLTVAGNAVLDGTIDVNLLDGFQPVVGNSFTILTTTFGNVGGQFDTELLPTIGGVTFDVVYNQKSVVLQAVAATTLPGDFNNDGAVDAADYVVWRKGIPPANNPADYTTWRQHFGEAHSGAGDAADYNPAVPEPTSLLLVLVATAACGLARFR